MTPISLETLENRALLSPMPAYGGYYGYYPTPMPTPTPVMPSPSPTPTTPVLPTPSPTPTSGHAHHQQNTPGVVTKTPHFYQFYKGPRLAELNAVKASAEISADGTTITFTGTNQGRINKAPATYVWGIDRNGSLSPGPFQGRPNVRFDAVVTVSLSSSLAPTATVVDQVSGTTTALPAGSASISGRTVTVTVPMSLLPSTGLAPAQYRFNYWPEDGMTPATSAVVGSFLPETSNAQVGVL
jgi:hypothetical protein